MNQCGVEHRYKYNLSTVYHQNRRRDCSFALAVHHSDAEGVWVFLDQAQTLREDEVVAAV
jgi:hypothetical protein